MAISKLFASVAVLAVLMAYAAPADAHRKLFAKPAPASKVTLCHYNGAAYDLITVSANAWGNGHGKHGDCRVCTDGCQAACGPNVLVDTTAKTCSCAPGWTGDVCTVDVDECALNTDDCEQTCNNTAGGFTCSCADGFTLNEDGKTCTADNS